MRKFASEGRKKKRKDHKWCFKELNGQWHTNRNIGELISGRLCGGFELEPRPGL